MRAFILSLPARLQPVLIITGTIVLAFLIASLFGFFFDAHQLESNTDLISSVYQVLGTLYAILLTFSLWGVWQNFTDAGNSVQNEAYGLVDLVHMTEFSVHLKNANVRQTALAYAKCVVEDEWCTLHARTHASLSTSEKSRALSLQLVAEVQNIVPHDPREMAIFDQTLKTLNHWLDSRRTRILRAEGNSAKALWPLLTTGALLLFGFHGLFVAKTVEIWVALLTGLSLLVGLAFYLIFSLDCPFSGSLSIDTEPFEMAINILAAKNPNAMA
jgi:hypothetical protein